jgi:hypothetical protein
MPEPACGIEIDPGPVIWRPRVPAGVPIDIFAEPDTHILIHIGREHGPIALTSPVDSRPMSITTSSISVERQPDTTLQGARGEGLRVVHVLGRPSNLNVTSLSLDPSRISATASGAAVRRGYADPAGILARIMRHPVVVLLVLVFGFLLALLLIRRAAAKSTA